MGSWRNLAVFAAATCVALGAARDAGATATDFYGNNFDENVLVPFAQCGPGGNDTLFAVTNPGVPAWPAATDLHVFVFNRDSIEACDFVVPFTPLDVYPDSFCRILAEECGDAGRTLLDNGDGSSVAYITIEGDAGGVDVDVGDALYGNVYYTDLGNNRATGLPAATFDPEDVGGLFESGQILGLDEFPLLLNHQISFRFLQALAGDRNAASTRGIIWSATTGSCQNVTTATPVPDSNCLVGTGASASVNYCDEAERCTSGPRPPVDREINIFSVDSFIPGSFATDGGYFNLQGNTVVGGLIGNFAQVDVIHVIGITDQEATIGGTPAVRAAYYAPRD